MPPDRTVTNHFATAAAFSLPLSSHGPAHAPSLERGKASDGSKPVCLACSKSAIAHGEDPSSITCNYDDAERGEKRKRSNNPSKVASLEAKIAELEKIIADAAVRQQQQPPVPPTSSATSFIDPTTLFGTTSSYAGSSAPQQQPSPPSTLDALLKATTSTYPAFSTYSPDQVFQNNPAPSSSSSSPACQMGFPAPGLVGVPGSGMRAAVIEEVEDEGRAAGDDPLLELFYPGWPRDLPSPQLVNRLVEVYFSKTHAATGMINRARFLTSLQLPPTHSGFPHTSLIHAILATSSRMVSGDFFAGESKYWLKPSEGGGGIVGLGEEGNPSDWHARKAKAEIDASIGKGLRMFQITQATVLVCYHAYSSAKFVEVWLYCGLACRMAGPLGLNHLRKASDSTLLNRSKGLKPSMLPPTDDDEEFHERSATFWFAVACDRFSSASTGWAMSLDDADITSSLPCPPGVFPNEGEDIAASPLSPHNPNFLMSHPPHLVQSLQLYIKSLVLLGRVVSFIQRAPSPAGYGLDPISRDPQDPYSQPDKFDLRATPAFKRLDADAVTFRLSVPREFQLQTTPDSRLSLVAAVPHVCTILLHEPFCSMDDGDVSFARCLLSARAILSSIYGLWGTSFEIGQLAPFLNFCWAVAGRTLVRELSIKQEKQQPGTEQIITDIKTIIASMKACRSGLGESTAAMLQGFLNDPSSCLPSSQISFSCGNGVPVSVFVDGAQPETLPKHGTAFPAPASASASYPSSSSSYSFPSSSFSTSAPSSIPSSSSSLKAFNHISPYDTSSGSSNGASPVGAPTPSSAPSPVDFAALFAQATGAHVSPAMFGDVEQLKQSFDLTASMQINLDGFQWAA